MLVNNAADLTRLRLNATTLDQTYALGADIDATSFVPSGGANLTGILDGFGGISANHTISNLTFGGLGGLNPVGLFGFVDKPASFAI